MGVFEQISWLDRAVRVQVEQIVGRLAELEYTNGSMDFGVIEKPICDAADDYEGWDICSFSLDDAATLGGTYSKSRGDLRSLRLSFAGQHHLARFALKWLHKRAGEFSSFIDIPFRVSELMSIGSRSCRAMSHDRSKVHISCGTLADIRHAVTYRGCAAASDTSNSIDHMHIERNPWPLVLLHKIGQQFGSTSLLTGGFCKRTGVLSALVQFAPLKRSHEDQSEREKTNIQGISGDRISLFKPPPTLWQKLLFFAFALGSLGLIVFIFGLFQESIPLQNFGFSCCVGAILLAFGTAFGTEFIEYCITKTIDNP